MTHAGKDSAEVVRFMSLYARLKEYCDDSPGDLSEQAKTDSSVLELCVDLFSAANFLKMNERRHRTLFAAPVDPAFLSAWRDYEDRYETEVSTVWASDLILLPSIRKSDKPKAELRWEIADNEAEAEAAGIQEAIDFAEFNADQSDRWDTSQEDFILQIQQGIAAWERLAQDTGFDLRGVFRRRALVPFVLVPRNVAATYGSAEKLSMLKNLQQAHDAFVFGAYFAALALMRSILEAVLRDHYGATEGDLVDRIRAARNRLPRGADEAALHRLRKLANAILHLDKDRDEGLEAVDDIKLEKEIVSLLFVLRALIEGVR